MKRCHAGGVFDNKRVHLLSGWLRLFLLKMKIFNEFCGIRSREQGGVSYLPFNPIHIF